MVETPNDRFVRFLRWSEKYTKTDMVYLTSSGFWFNLTSVATAFFSLILYIVFAHFVPKEVYGTYQYLLSVAAIISTITLTGMNGAVTRSVARGQEGAVRASIRVQVLWNLVPASAALIGALYYLVAGNLVLAAGFALIAITTPLVNAYNTYSALLSGKRHFRRAFFYSLTLNIPYYGLLMLFAFSLPQIIPLFAVNVLVNTALAMFLYYRTLRVEKPNDVPDERALPYARHLTAINTLSALASQVDGVLVFHFLGPLDLAIYSFATAVPDRLVGFFRFFGAVAFPKLVLRSPTEIRATIGYKILQVSVLGLLLAAFYALIAPLFFHTLFPQYAASIPYSQLYALTMIGAASNLALTALISQERIRELYLFNTIFPLVQIAVLFTGLVWLGLWGLIAAKVLTNIVSMIGVSALLILRTPTQRNA